MTTPYQNTIFKLVVSLKRLARDLRQSPLYEYHEYQTPVREAIRHLEMLIEANGKLVEEKDKLEIERKDLAGIIRDMRHQNRELARQIQILGTEVLERRAEAWPTNEVEDEVIKDWIEGSTPDSDPASTSAPQVIGLTEQNPELAPYFQGKVIMRDPITGRITRREAKPRDTRTDNMPDYGTPASTPPSPEQSFVGCPPNDGSGVANPQPAQPPYIGVDGMRLSPGDVFHVPEGSHPVNGPYPHMWVGTDSEADPPPTIGIEAEELSQEDLDELLESENINGREWHEVPENPNAGLYAELDGVESTDARITLLRGKGYSVQGATRVLRRYHAELNRRELDRLAEEAELEASEEDPVIQISAEDLVKSSYDEEAIGFSQPRERNLQPAILTMLRAIYKQNQERNA